MINIVKQAMRFHFLGQTGPDPENPTEEPAGIPANPDSGETPDDDGIDVPAGV